MKEIWAKAAENTSTAITANPNMTAADVRRRGGAQRSLNDSQLRHWQAPDNIPVPLRVLWLLQIWMVLVLSATWDVSVSVWQALLSARGSRAACRADVYTKQNTCTHAPTGNATKKISLSHIRYSTSDQFNPVQNTQTLNGLLHGAVHAAVTVYL